MPNHHRTTAALLAAATLGLGAGAPPSASAHETDQFLMPADRESAEFADLGRYFSDYFSDAIRGAVHGLNRQIDDAEAREAKAQPKHFRVVGRKTRRAARRMTEQPAAADAFRTPAAIANAVRDELPDALSLIDGLEWNPPDATAYGYADDAIVIYKPHDQNAMHTRLHFVLDPRILGRLWRAGTFKAYDAYMGADKIGHFVDMGYRYYKVFDGARRGGAADDAAYADAVHFGVRGGLLSENMLLGRATAGAFSNADLASNFAGLRFYINLAEPLLVEADPGAGPDADGYVAMELLPPLARLNDAGRWELTSRIDDDPDFFAAYLTDHFNEALNPSHFERGMRRKVRAAIADRWHRVAQWYTDADGNPRPAAWHADRARRLAKLDGLDYGHLQRWDELYNLGNVAPASGDDVEYAGAPQAEPAAELEVEAPAAEPGETAEPQPVDSALLDAAEAILASR